jgi:hypothetical protein
MTFQFIRAHKKKVHFAKNVIVLGRDGGKGAVDG